MSSYAENVEKVFDEQMAEFRKNKANLMVVGGTGVGKSSLINKVFGKDFAAVGTGEPVTKRITRYTSKDSPINIFDTVGYETKGENDLDKFEGQVLQEIDNRSAEKLSEQIHIIWYCISITNKRIFPYDIENILSLGKRSIPLFSVFTKCDEDAENEDGNGKIAAAYRQVLQEKGLGQLSVFETSAIGDTSFMLEDLLEDTAKSIKDEKLRNAFVAAQIGSVRLKRKSAGDIIHLASVAAGAAGAIPIPVADAPIITGLQMTMAVKLANIYGFSMLGEAATSLLKSQLLSLAGKQLAASATKFIPFLGQIINASVAFAFTEALGWTLTEIYESAAIAYLETGKMPPWSEIFSGDMISTFFSQYFKG